METEIEEYNFQEERPDAPEDYDQPQKTPKVKTKAALYITPCELGSTRLEKSVLKKLSIKHYNVDNTIQTECGLLLNLPSEYQAKQILKKDLAALFGRPVYAVTLPTAQYKRTVKFKDIPSCIRKEELEHCIKNQGIKFRKVWRTKSSTNIEVGDSSSYHTLKNVGIMFYDSAVFQAEGEELPEVRNWDEPDDIIQCFNCQSFWHTQNSCREPTRCARCGEDHPTHLCKVSRINPKCCNCNGDHHAGCKTCPERIRQINSLKVSISYDKQGAVNE